MSATVTKLPSAKRAAKPAAPKPAAARKPSARAVAADRLAIRGGIASLAIFGAGMALSLAHQAHGVASFTHVAGWEAWATAIEIDLGFIAAKGLPYLARTDGERSAVEKWTKPLAIACFLLCAWFNAAGYVAFVPDAMCRSVVGVVLGGFVPGVMLAMSQVSRILLTKRA